MNGILKQMRGGRFAWNVLRRYLTARVHSGPFKGINYISESHGSVLLSKYLGTYERELHPWLNRILISPPESVIIVGSAEGYYAVGFASRNRVKQVTAFEADPTARNLLANLADKNEVRDKLIIKGACTPEALGLALAAIPPATQPPLIIVDVEGYERELLNPQTVPALVKCDLIVELHDFIDPTIGTLVKSRLAETHVCETTLTEPRTLGDAAGILPWWISIVLGRNVEGPLRAYMDEHRPATQGFAYFRTRHRS